MSYCQSKQRFLDRWMIKKRDLAVVLLHDNVKTSCIKKKKKKIWPSGISSFIYDAMIDDNRSQANISSIEANRIVFLQEQS
jgi:hypothetical protein